MKKLKFKFAFLIIAIIVVGFIVVNSANAELETVDATTYRNAGDGIISVENYGGGGIQLNIDNLPAGKRIYAEGELSLGGEVKSTPGSCIRLKTISDMDFDYKIIPGNESVSAAIAGVMGQAINNLTELNAIFDGTEYKESVFRFEPDPSADDFLDISLLKGQEKTKRALLISAAGFHNIILLGSPGSGKTMA